jgi:hypothetical protein
VSFLASLVVAMTVGAVVGFVAGMAVLRRARLRREVRERDPWWQWQKQWQRVGLGLRRVEAIYEGREGDSADVLYDLYSFFLNCHELRDWLAADKVSGMSRKKATKVIKGSAYLRVCADLANRTQHAELTRHWIDSNTSPVPHDATIFVGPGKVAHRWEIAAGDATYDALDLAANCVAEWERTLTDRGLLDARRTAPSTTPDFD